MIIATAGHVDHGKTSLVRHLTGVDTDRLEEEKRRGLSISLGYAYWRPREDVTVGFIDVPGHRRFINNMISGITGIDVGLLVVAADDGPMPQTLEHIDVMTLLGVDRYVLVVSKCDRVDAARVATVSADAAALVPAGTPVHIVSNTTGEGIAALRDGLAALAGDWQARAASGSFRMSIDRAFHIQGRGLIVTGTVASGSLAVGETVTLQPQGTPVRVRSIHAQDTATATGQAGQRCAINVSGDVHKDDIERGDWLCGENCVGTTSRFDAHIRLLPNAAFPLKHLSTIKLHIGAKLVEARLVILRNERSDIRRLSPGDGAYAQFVTDRPVVCCRGDRFLLRDFGETATLGGGVVLDPHGAVKHRSSASRLSFLSAMRQDRIDDAIGAALEDEGVVLEYGRLLKAWNLDPDNRPGRLIKGVARIDTGAGQVWLSSARWSNIRQAVLDALGDFHRDHPEQAGIEQSLLARRALTSADRQLFGPAIAELEASGDVRLSNGLVAFRDFTLDKPGQDDPAWATAAKILSQHGLQIPGLAQFRDETGLPAPTFSTMLEAARRDGRVIRINAERYADANTVNQYAQAVLALTEGRQSVTVAGCRDYLGCGRNILIDILEYFDSIGFTRRVGNARIVLDRNLPAKRFSAPAAQRITTGKSDVPGGAPGLQNQ